MLKEFIYNTLTTIQIVSIKLNMSFQSKILIKLKSTCLFFVLPLQLIAQDITGLWTGFLQIDTTKLLYELVISKNENEFTGYSITVFVINDVENMGG